MAGYGLEPVRQATGGTIRANNFCDGNGYRIAATAPSAFFEGDLVQYSSGNIVTDMGSASPGAVIGVFFGAEYSDNSTGDVKFVRSIPASTVAKAKFKAYVYDDPNTLFKVQADQASSALTAANVGNNLQIVASPTGSTVTFKSGLVADSSTIATTNTFPLQLLGSAETDLGFSAAGTTMDILVRINSHQHRLGATGVTGIA
jgi:hypothetical protein|tara:strand:- start:2 stop:607 length:606 start_codon:yes stop_codon:yes gene_type:complete